jgi:hypothetical protein
MRIKILVTSSNLSILTAVLHKTEDLLKYIKIFRISHVDDVIMLWRILNKYIQDIKMSSYDYCLFTPVLGVAPYISRVLNIPFFTHQILIVVKRSYITSLTSLEMFQHDAATWINRIMKHNSSKTIDKDLELSFMIYYDRETLWQILLSDIPIIISVDYDKILSIGKCKEFSVVQFTRYSAFKGLPIDVNSGEAYVITPTPLYQDSKKICNPLTCIDVAISSPYSFNNEIEFLQRFQYDNLKKMEKIFIEFWSSMVYLDRDAYDYIWFFTPLVKDLSIAGRMLASRNTMPKIVKVALLQDLFAEFGAINSKRIWISLLLKNIIVNSKTKVVFI